MLTNKTDR